MKIRNTFVANSSSVSYVLVGIRDPGGYYTYQRIMDLLEQWDPVLYSAYSLRIDEEKKRLHSELEGEKNRWYRWSIFEECILQPLHIKVWRWTDDKPDQIIGKIVSWGTSEESGLTTNIQCTISDVLKMYGEILQYGFNGEFVLAAGSEYC